MRCDRLIREPVPDVVRQCYRATTDEQDPLELGTAPKLALRLGMQALDQLPTRITELVGDIVVFPNRRTLPLRTASSVTRSDSSSRSNRPRMASATAFEIQQPAAQRTGTVVTHRLVGDHDEIRGPATDIYHRDRHAEPLGLELHTLVRVRDNVVVPGRQRLGNDLVERDRGRLAAVDGLHGLFETRLLALDDLQALTAVLEVKTADRQAGHRMHRPSGKPGLVQRMLDDRAIETRERVAVRMRRLPVHLPTANTVSSVSYSNTLCSLPFSQVTFARPISARDGIAIKRPSGKATLVNA